MCGINGFNFNNKDIAKKMQFFTKNRGPDFSDIYCNDEITLTHDRLSIIDTSSLAHQPFRYKNLVISYNGEVFNFKNLRLELEDLGYEFKTNSDTEVIIYLFDKFGIDSFKKLSGIFSISIWDNDNKSLFLIRDTVGVKPLFYFFDKKMNKFYFSSSIRSILVNTDKKINKVALKFYQNFGRNDDHETFYKNIYKVKPGELLIFKKDKLEKIAFLKYNFVKKPLKNKSIKKNIEEAISSQLVSDVPIALSLSGGVDSNIIYSVMRERLGKNLNIYSYYFKGYDRFNQDYKIAKENTNFFKDKLIPVEVTHEDFSSNLEKVSEILEEPLWSQGAILNYLMSKQVKEKVLLTGDGGDEIFTGYDQYKSIYILSMISKLNIFNFIKTDFKNKNFNRVFFNDSLDFYISFSEKNLFDKYQKVFNNYNSVDKENLKFNHTNNFSFSNRLNDVCFMEMDNRLVNDYLRRCDSIFMDNGIEARVPLLDKNIIEKNLMMSEFKKFDYRFKSKGLLKKIFNKEIHKLTKTKWGLQSPLAHWLQGPLIPFVRQILSKTYYNSEQYLNFEEIDKFFNNKVSFKDSHIIWSLLMFQIFLKKNRL
jgi:asparagine synthase (glutamine-hydrolysing)